MRSLHTRPATDVYVTGSNAHMLSSDLATLLSGRYVSVPVHPLSFSEYLSFLEAYGEPSAEDAAFADYLRFGGMPGLFALRELTQEGAARELSAIMDTIDLSPTGSVQMMFAKLQLAQSEICKPRPRTT